MNKKQNYLIHYGVKKEHWSPEARARFDAKHNGNRKEILTPSGVDTKPGHTYVLETGEDVTDKLAKSKGKEWTFSRMGFGYRDKYGVGGAGSKIIGARRRAAFVKKHQNEIREKQLAAESEKNHTKVLSNGRTLHSRRRNPRGKLIYTPSHVYRAIPVNDGSYQSPYKKVGNNPNNGMKTMINTIKKVQDAIADEKKKKKK